MPHQREAMSVPGSSRHSGRRPTTSGLPWKRTSSGPVAMSQKVPQADDHTAGLPADILSTLLHPNHDRAPHRYSQSTPCRGPVEMTQYTRLRDEEDAMPEAPSDMIIRLIIGRHETTFRANNP